MVSTVGSSVGNPSFSINSVLDSCSSFRVWLRRVRPIFSTFHKVQWHLISGGERFVKSSNVHWREGIFHLGGNRRAEPWRHWKMKGQQSVTGSGSACSQCSFPCPELPLGNEGKGRDLGFSRTVSWITWSFLQAGMVWDITNGDAKGQSLQASPTCRDDAGRMWPLLQSS